jgi:hypothetical protein
MNKVIKIKFIGFWPGFDYKKVAFFNFLKQEGLIEIINNSNEADINIYSDHYNKIDISKKNIFYTFEQTIYKDWLFNYTITSKKNDTFNFQLHNFYYYPYFEEVTNRSETEHYLKLKNKKKNKYINFIYSNSNCNLRNEYYNFLSKSKKIDSYGKLFNNIRHFKNNSFPEGQKNLIISDYKYTIAFENSKHENYVTEKIWQPICLNSIPIYWGDKSVFNFFNKKKIIYIEDINDFKKSLIEIDKIDSSNQLYLEMLNEDIFTNNEAREYYQYAKLAKRFIIFLNKVLDSDARAKNNHYKFLKYVLNKIYHKLLTLKKNIKL